MHAPAPTATAESAAADEARLDCLAADFPQFRISREATVDRVRYVARRRQPGTRPHTVVTDDLSELREVLTAG
jgi:hypothetical protein